ncbi:hypothetical protein KBC86_04465 [Candidatus Gracilibacteria bacterium]|nr:hypothetical protein [Candidatus Gracilibacteria bacterium]
MKEKIALNAWEIVTEFSSLKKVNFFASFIGTFWLFLVLIYQITFTYIRIFQQKDRFIQIAFDFMHKTYFAEVLIGFGVFLLLYIMVAPLAEGAIIEMIHSYRRSNGEKRHRSLQGIFDGFRHFLPLFEVHNIVAIFRPLSIITFYILLLRLFGKEYFVSVTWAMGIYLLFAFFLNMCFAYAKFFIIFEGKPAIQSLSASTGMAVRHIGITMQLYYTMILLYLRTLIVALIFLVLPFIISAIVAWFTIISVQIGLLIIFGILCFVLFIVIVHLNSTLEIFIEATWYEAYQICKKEDKEWDDEHGGHGHDEHGHSESHGHESAAHGKDEHAHH